MAEDAVLRIIEETAENKRSDLDLSYNELTTLPPEIGELANLTVLDLYGNQLTTLPPEIGELANLTKLYRNYSPPPQNLLLMRLYFPS